MENNVVEPAVAEEEKKSDAGRQTDAKPASCNDKNENDTQTKCIITSKSGERMASETQSESSGNNCELTETDIKKSIDVSSCTEANGVITSQKTDPELERSKTDSDNAEVNGVKCDVVANTVNDSIGEPVDSENQGDVEDAAVNEPMNPIDNESEDSEDLLLLEKMQADPVYQKNATSLLQLCSYGSESECEENGEKQSEKAAEVELHNGTEELVSNAECTVSSKVSQSTYRKPPVEVISDTDSEEDSEEDSSSSSESTSSSDESDIVVVPKRGGTQDKPQGNSNKEVPKTKGELSLEDLPPIEDLYITVPESECVEVGCIMNIVESLVVVQASKGSPALDLDSVLFLDQGKRALGQIFDVFGSVSEPCYCVRFNSNEHAKEKGIEKGIPVYFAPRTKHANFVFVKDLMKAKGSDASWEHNNEPPEKFLEFSDDEEERRMRRGKADVKHESDTDSSQRPKKQAFRRMQRGRKQQQQDNQGSHFSNPYQGNPWSSQNTGRPFTPSDSPSPAFQQGPHPLVRPPAFNSPAPFANSTNVDNLSQSSTINPWLVPLPAQNYAFPPLQQQFSPGPVAGYTQHPQNFTPPNTSFTSPNPNFTSPNSNFSSHTPNFASPNANFTLPNSDFPTLGFGPFGPVAPNSRHPGFSQPPPGW